MCTVYPASLSQNGKWVPQSFCMSTQPSYLTARFKCIPIGCSHALWLKMDQFHALRRKPGPSTSVHSGRGVRRCDISGQEPGKTHPLDHKKRHSPPQAKRPQRLTALPASPSVTELTTCRHLGEKKGHKTIHQ